MKSLKGFNIVYKGDNIKSNVAKIQNISEKVSTYHISTRNSKLGKSRSKFSATFKGVFPGVLDITVHNRRFIIVDQCWPLQEADGREWGVICRASNHTLHWIWLQRQQQQQQQRQQKFDVG